MTAGEDVVVVVGASRGHRTDFVIRPTPKMAAALSAPSAFDSGSDIINQQLDVVQDSFASANAAPTPGYSSFRFESSCGTERVPGIDAANRDGAEGSALNSLTLEEAYEVAETVEDIIKGSYKRVCPLAARVM